jgi:Bacterial Ig-like domain (group 3)/FG-GAP-like repeat
LSNPNSGSARVGTITVLPGNGDGTFQPATVVFENTGTYGLSAMAVADVNGDGKTDLILGFAPDQVSVFRGNGDGTFQPGENYGSGADGYPDTVTVADVNGDGKPDLLVGNQNSKNIGVLLGNGDGTFGPVATYGSGPSAEPWSIAVADVNGDGKPDLLVADYNNSSGELGVLLGNGDGTFQNVVIYDAGPFDSLSVAVADLNGDGKPDAVVADWCNCGSGWVAVLLSGNATTTALVSSLNPSIFGQTVTFTASVSSDFKTPSGTVVFSDGSTALGSATLAGGKASLSVSSLPAGSDSITAAYQGAPAYNPSTSSPTNQVVTGATSTPSLASSLNPVPLLEYITYIATVTSQYGGAVTGTVTFEDGGSTVATVNVQGSQAAFKTSYKATGSHAMTATYSGDQNNGGSSSATLMERVITGRASKTVLASSGSPTFVGQTVTFTATVTSKSGTIPDGELVTFYDGTTGLASVALASGKAGYTTSSLSAATHTIKAVYPGDPTFQPSTGTVKQTVLKYATTISLASNPNPSNHGQTVTFTATVTPTGPYPVTGKVKFWDGTTGLGAVAVNGGVAILKKSTLGVGTHPITAQYAGDVANDKSTSPVENQVVQ